MALVVVLVLTAAVSLTTLGVVRSVKGLIRQTDRLQAELVLGKSADAALALWMQRFTAAKNLNTEARLAELTIEVHGRTWRVSGTPLVGKVSLSSASEPLLAAVFRYVGQMPADESQALAVQVAAFRRPGQGTSVAEGFSAVEDLMRVPGMTLDAYVKVAPALTVYGSASGKVHPLYSPHAVLLALAEGNESVAQTYENGRYATGVDATGLNPAWTNRDQSAGAMSLQAQQLDVASGAGVGFVRYWTVLPGSVYGNGEGWQVITRHGSWNFIRD